MIECLYFLLRPSLLDVQSILDVGSSFSAHLGGGRPLKSYRSVLRYGFDICDVLVDLDSNFILKALLTKS